jgi:hypothetical protein
MTVLVDPPLILMRPCAETELPAILGIYAHFRVR